MAKQAHLRRPKKLHSLASSDNTLQNKVHELIAYIEAHFSKEDQVKRSFATAALTGALGFLDEISKAEGIPKQRKIQLLTKIYEAASRKIDALAEAQPSVPLWEDRTDWRMSPCAFVEKYPNYKRGLTTDDIKDRKLLKALQNYKSRYGWPEGFDLPSKSEALDRLVAEQGPDIHLRGLADAPARVRRERGRAWHAKYRRLGK